MAFGEAYVAGDWTPGPGTDLADLLTPFAAKLQDLVPAPLRRMRRVIDRRLPHDTRNTPDGSRTNISAHYDMSNDLFSMFLDETMTYSSAWFSDFEHESLESAQLRKLDGILDLAGVGDGTRLLEIGSGWGSLAIRAAQRGAQVTTITLSDQQADLANTRIKRLGLDPLVDVRLQDYRDVDGEYDAIVSVEMIEAVGEEFWPSYFSTIDRHLAPGGRVAIQAITMAHDRMLETRNSYGWIQKYIFPGGLIPSIQAIEDVCREHTVTPDHPAPRARRCTTPRRCAAGGCGSSRSGTRSPSWATTRASAGSGSSTSPTARPGSARGTSASASSSWSARLAARRAGSTRYVGRAASLAANPRLSLAR